MTNDATACNYEDYKKEMIDGNIYMMSLVDSQHALVVSDLCGLLWAYFNKNKKECKVTSERLAVHLC